MSAEAMFQNYLAGISDVTSLVSAGKIITGEVQQETLAVPYITINCEETKGPEGNTISSRDGTLTLEVFAGTLTAGKAIAEALRSALHNKGLSYLTETMPFVRLSSQDYLQEPDGILHFSQIFEYRIQL